MLPERVGRYEVSQILGRGGAAIVYLARDPVIDRLVALKTLRRDLHVEHVEEFRPRFLREARAAGRLSHPGIVTIFDAGEDLDAGVLFIAMEFVDGSSLKDLIRTGTQLPIARVLELGVRLADALDFAHSHGVVHRDIKPANVMLTRSGQAKIADFGIARMPSPESTVEGMVLGTPSYMSPEQVIGKSVDGRCDVYALGVVLFELLAGRVPFSADSLEELSVKILQQPAPSLLELRPDLAPGLAPVITRCLEKRPQDRFQSGAELARALGSIGGGATVSGLGASLPGASALPSASQGVDETFSTTMKTGEVAARVQAEVDRRGSGLPGAKRASIRRVALFSGLALAVALAAGSLALRSWGPAAEVVTAPPAPSDAPRVSLVEASKRLEKGDFQGAIAAATELLDHDPGLRGARKILDEAHRRMQLARSMVTLSVSFPSPTSRGTLRVSVDGKPHSPITWSFGEKVGPGIRLQGKGQVHGAVSIPPGAHQLRLRLDPRPGGITADTVIKQEFSPGSRWAIGLDTSGKAGTATFLLHRVDAAPRPIPDRPAPAPTFNGGA
jgi:tRNA A-37 threonylcarbamoyl transferase component Bud32